MCNALAKPKGRALDEDVEAEEVEAATASGAGAAAQGAAFAQLPLIDRFDTDITAAIASGDHLRVDPAQGLVQILR